VVAAHGGSLGGQRASLSVPLWLFLLTGGAAVGASFLLASFVTDRALIREIHAAGRELGLSRGLLVPVARAVGVLGLVAVVAVGLFGPADPLSNLGVLVVWAGWWAGYTMSVYLVGNSWPVLNPWRTLAGLVPSLDREYPERLGAWPATVGLLALIWLEVVSPLADDPRLLAGVVLAYTAATLAGAAVFGADSWFDTVDPVSQVFRWYGRMAPFQRTGDGLALRLPGSALAGRLSPSPVVADGGAEADQEAGLDEVGFVVALLWATTYDGFVATTAWRSLAAPFVEAGVPAGLLYPLALAAGFGLFFGLYWLAADYGRQYADTYRSTAELARRFAPSLVAIAAGYHAAHYLGYFIELSPALTGALVDPLAPATPQLAVLPGWFGVVGLVAVLVGHWLAVWVAHATAFELFPGRMQAIRSQYPLAGAMVLFTMSSLFVVAQPTIAPPFL
jgi:hypothetical protein